MKKSNRSSLRIPENVIWSGIILTYLVWAFLYSLTSAINAPTFHLDGAFQTASGLFRLAAHQYPGQDFYPYLGIGPLFSLYPSFLAAGAKLCSSQFSAQFMILLIGALATSMLWHLILRPKSFLNSLAGGATLFAAPMVIAGALRFNLPYLISFASSPGNSLRPVRAFAPYLIMIPYYLGIRNARSSYLKYSLCGLVSGTVLLWSNDFAFPSVGLFAVFLLFNAFQERESKLKPAILFCFTTLLTWFLLLYLSTHGHPLNLLKYNFIDVAQDQWWLFGFYDKSHRIFGPLDFYKLINRESLFPLIILVASLFVCVKSKRFEDYLVFWIGLVLLSGGTVASVGGHLGGYFSAFSFWALTVVVLLWTKKILALPRVQAIKTWYLTHQDKVWAGVLLFTSLSALGYGVHFQRTLAIARKDTNRFWVPELGGFLERKWQRYVELARSDSSTHVYEEYWGLWSAIRRVFPEWPVDSVIHALGNIRPLAREQLSNRNLAITTRYSTSPEWQPWNVSQNYWLYEGLFRNFTPSYYSPTSVVWVKDKHPRTFPASPCEVSPGTHPIQLSAPVPGYYQVHLSYSFQGSGRHLVMVENNFNFGSDINGFVSVNPKGSSVDFPVYVHKAGAQKLNLKVTGRGKYVFAASACQAFQIPFRNPEVLSPVGGMDENFFLTDANWEHGVARPFAGFFLRNSEQFVNDFQVGKYVHFPDGETRRIVDAQTSGVYLNVFVNGPPLLADKVGMPSSFVVSQSEKEEK